MMSLSRLPILVFSALLAFSSLVDAKRLYRWVDQNGVTHFSDEEPDFGAEQVFPSGMSVIPMGGNIQTQKNMEKLKGSDRKPSPRSGSRATSSWVSDRAAYEEKRKRERQLRLCQGYEDRIEWIDSRLRAGGYSVGYGNRLRAERRDLANTRAWECLRNN